MVNIEKEYIMKSMLNSLRERMKDYIDVTIEGLASIYLGELRGFEIFFNNIVIRGDISGEAEKINHDFKRELEGMRQILAKKFESGELKS